MPEDVKEERWHRLMNAQQLISYRRLKRKIGQRIHVIIDEINDDGAVGRSEGDAPEIDGNVLVSGGEFAVGDIVEVEVRRAGPYDLFGEAVHS